MHTDTLTFADSQAMAARFIHGCQHAFAGLYRLHAGWLVRRASRWVGERSQDAQDLVHDAFLSAWAARESLRDPARFCAWLGKITFRLAQQRRYEDLSLETPELVMDDSPDALALLIHKRQWMSLRGAIPQLSPRQQCVVKLRTQEALPFRDIASQLECSDVAARVNYRHGVRALQKLMVS